MKCSMCSIDVEVDTKEIPHGIHSIRVPFYKGTDTMVPEYVDSDLICLIRQIVHI